MNRILAVVALISAAACVAIVLIFTIRNGVDVAFGLLGIAVAGAGAWWVVTERRLRRAGGVLILFAGLAITISALADAVSGPGALILRVAVAVIPFALATACARQALVPELHALDQRRAAHIPRRPVLICNPKSGDGKVERFDLVGAAREIGVETIVLGPDDDLAQLARDAIERGADCLGMAGGDGSQALVASIAIDHDIPFVCVTAGTRNHFALDLGLDRDDPRKTLSAFTDGIEHRVDYATANGRLFVNNTSLGVYAEIVQKDSYRGDKTKTFADELPNLLGREASSFDIQFTDPDGREIDGAYLVLVSNNPYTTTASLEAVDRPSLETGRLGVVAVSASTAAEAAALMARSAVGLRRTSPYWHEFTATEFQVRARSGRVAAGVDGEALDFDTPLDFRIHPGGLRILVPAGTGLVRARRRARGIPVSALVDVARGRPMPV
ncbi:diacylglycerol kinase family protein [Gordonia sp. ABSL1-1]|uniref:diacylglycerol/lipid kinase family protein n=1 Tax=Gordonia sp. ABSL1-1 TaxID=3053923 RepID=UPI0025739B38|nr:diacylglycerol kinase family protein [Gordonia sp. ABSL1-1]MDL9935729.1 diacylglycerol kinase family protein [Gordonia sp. ABSL1-1]